MTKLRAHFSEQSQLSETLPCPEKMLFTINITAGYRYACLPRQVCPASETGYPVYIPHPTNCSLFYECVGRRPVLLSCPAQLFFDPGLEVCNWPWLVDCTNQETTTEESTDPTEESTEPRAEQTARPERHQSLYSLIRGWLLK